MSENPANLLSIPSLIASFEAKHPKIVHFFHSRWRFAFYLPAYLLLLTLIHYIFAFSPTPYSGSSNGWASPEKKVAFIILLELFFAFVAVWLILNFMAKRLTSRKIAFAFVLVSSAILILFSFLRYMNFAGYKHDWGANDPDGHFAIIYDIFNTGKIPDQDLTRGQYYQPKFWHALMALCMKINSLFIHAPEGNALVTPAVLTFPLYDYQQYALLESCRIWINFYGTLSLYFLYRIYVRLFEKGLKLCIASAFLAITPVFWYVPFYGNNDSLSFAFALMGLLFALEYRKSKSFVDIILSGVGIGLGMMCKLSNALVALPVAFIFVLELIERIKGKGEGEKFFSGERKRFFFQILIFAIVVFPLGLGLHVYNRVAFGEPIGYVLDLEWSTGEFRQNFMHIDSAVYNPFQRFFSFPQADLWFSMFNLRYCQTRVDGWWVSAWGEQDFNVWTAFLKTALWGESTLSLSSAGLVFASIAYYFYIIAGIFFLIFLVLYTVKAVLDHKSDYFLYGLMAITFISVAASYIYFSAKYPVGCSMNARYALLLFIPIQVVLASGFVDLGRLLGKLRCRIKARSQKEKNEDGE